MSSEISVERQFHFHCSCGATTVSGERTVTCTSCGITLGVRRVRRHRQHRRDSVAYYGSRGTLPVRRVEERTQNPNADAAIPSTPISPNWTIPVRRVERLRQNLDTAPPMARTTQQESVPHRPMPLQPVVSVAKENVDNRTPLTWWQRFLKRHIIDDYPYSDSD